MNTKLRTETKNDFEKYFFELLNNSVFGNTIENVRKHGVIKLVRTDKRRNQLVSEPNHHATKCFWGDLLDIEMKRMKVKMNKPIYLGMLILDISKTLMHEFWYDYTDTDIFRYMVTDSFIFHIKTEDFYREIVNDIKKWFDTSSYSEDDKRPLPRGMNRKVIG